ncbi:Protein OSB1, mitochondrial [Hordeum vulgare]|nr:Protein OSB1, mitochondrial [Hordeum vulgare]
MLRSLAAAVRSPAAAAWRRLLHHGRGIGGGEEAESMAYRMSMLRPPTVARKKDIISSNSCSLIGRLNAPVRLHLNSSEEDPKAYTFLCVTPSSSSSSSSTSSNFQLRSLYYVGLADSNNHLLFQRTIVCSNHGKHRVTLQMKGDLANVCLKHLKYKDLVHVSGFLNSYHKVSETGELYVYYKIHVKELNYVYDPKKARNDNDSVDPASTPSADTQTLEETKCRERLRLWQVFFASPYEWWDNRQYKPYAGCPDFKHKDTREQLWLHPDDPPWVIKQLKLIDQQTAESGHRDGKGRLTNPKWDAQDFNYSDECHDDEQDIRRQANG